VAPTLAASGAVASEVVVPVAITSNSKS
jgi:hypothetical protein